MTLGAYKLYYRDTRGLHLTTAVRALVHSCHGHRRPPTTLLRRADLMLSLILTHAVPSLYACTVHTMQAAWHVRVGMRVDIHADEACEIYACFRAAARCVDEAAIGVELTR